MKRLLLIFFVIYSHFNVYSQAKSQVQFIIRDLNQRIVTNGDIRLIILGKNYGNGPEHKFINGILYLAIPNDSTIKYTIQSSDFYPLILENEHNVVRGNSNVVRIAVVEVENQQLVIRGKVQEINGIRNVIGAKYELMIDEYESPITGVTDSLGNLLVNVPNGRKLIGNLYKISITHPSYLGVSTQGTIKNQKVFWLPDLILNRSLSVPVYNLRFSGATRALSSMSLWSEDYDITEIGKGNGFFQIVPKQKITEPLDTVTFKVISYGYRDISYAIGRKDLEKSEVYHLNLKVTLPKMTLTAGLAYSRFYGSEIGNPGSFNSEIGVQKFFIFYKMYFSVGLSMTIVSHKFSSLNEYLTLAGSSRQTENFYNLLKTPQLKICHFFSDPFTSSISAFAGISVAIIQQSQAKKNTNLNDNKDKITSLSPGLTGGINFDILKSISMQTFVDLSYIKLRTSSYKFNYFGRAEEDYLYPIRLGSSLNFSLLYHF